MLWKSLKDFGMGKRSSIESIITDELEELIDELRKTVGKPFSTQATFNPSVLNIIWVIVAGKSSQNVAMFGPIIIELSLICD